MKYFQALFYIAVCWVSAQQSPEFLKYQELYEDAHSVRLNQETTIRISIEDDEIKIAQEFLEEDLYLDDGATMRSKNALNFSAFFELENIEASSYNFENGKYKELKVSSFTEKDELGDSFYDDTKSVNFILPNLKKGSKSKIKYTENVKNPRFLSSFYFADFYPIINNKVSLIVDKNINLDFKEFNTEGLDIAFSKIEKRKNIIYTWEFKNADKFDYESGVSSYRKVLPHIIPIISSYTIDGKEIKLLESVAELYDWYYSLVKDINIKESDPNLVSLVNELTEGKTNDLDKVEAIYYWVQKNIKYVAFEYALGGFIPRHANDVYKKKYGDCKDNSSVLHEMLKIAGLKGNLTWIGTRSIPYKYEVVPTPVVDNHMILSYTQDGQTYYLDATGRYHTLDLPTSFIQGKEALIGNGEQGYELKTVPVIPAEKNSYIDSTSITIQDRKLVGTSRTVLSGYPKIDFFNLLEDKKTDEKLIAFYNAVFQKGNNKFLISSFNETNKFDYDKDLIVDYEFTIDQYAKHLSDEIYLNLNFSSGLSGYKTEDDRKNEIEFDYKSVYNFTTTLNIPEGYSVTYIPENTALKNDFMSFEISYTLDGSTLVYNNAMKFDFLTLSLEDQKEVNALIKQAEKALKEIIILKKN